MTVIAYDGKSIACDSQETICETPLKVETKLLPFSFFDENSSDTRYFIAGISGHPAEALGLIKHYLTGPWLLGRPQPCPYVEAGVILVELHRHGNPLPWTVTRLSGQCGVVDVTHIKWAMGSGADYALGAMHTGASAARGCEIACKLNTNCSGPVTSIPLDQWFRALHDELGVDRAYPPFTITERGRPHGPAILGNNQSAAVRGRRAACAEPGSGHGALRAVEAAEGVEGIGAGS